MVLLFAYIQHRVQYSVPWMPDHPISIWQNQVRAFLRTLVLLNLWVHLRYIVLRVQLYLSDREAIWRVVRSLMGSTLRRTDLLALSNLRNDGRKPHEIRRMRIQITDQGALVEMGLTTVLAMVRGPIECNRRAEEAPDR